MGDFGQGVQLFALSGTKRTFSCKHLQEVLRLREELPYCTRYFLLTNREELLLETMPTSA